jgi:hypothetical protein
LATACDGAGIEPNFRLTQPPAAGQPIIMTGEGPIYSAGSSWGLSAQAGSGLTLPGEHAPIEVRPIPENPYAKWSVTIDEGEQPSDPDTALIQLAANPFFCLSKPLSIGNTPAVAELAACSETALTTLNAKEVEGHGWEFSTPPDQGQVLTTQDDLIKGDYGYPYAIFIERATAEDPDSHENRYWTLPTLSTSNGPQVSDKRSGNQNSPANVVFTLVAKREEADRSSGVPLVNGRHSAILYNFSRPLPTQFPSSLKAS